MSGLLRGPETAPTPPVYRSSTAAEDLVQTEIELAQFAAVIAGANRQHPLTRGRFDGGTHGLAYRVFIDTVDYDLVAAIDPLDQFALDATSLCRAESVIRRGDDRVLGG